MGVADALRSVVFLCGLSSMIVGPSVAHPVSMPVWVASP